jgi:hypothetical protein
MKNIINVTTILSWINLVIGGLFVLLGILVGLASGNFLNALVLILLPGAIVLHSYAALQLRKSIVRPDIPLDNQTPIGIRFMGYIVLFFALFNIVYGISVLGNIPELAKQVKLPPEAANLNVVRLLRFAFVFSLLFSASIAANAIINLRLLKWYIKETRE